jgi:hypothetical protein
MTADKIAGDNEEDVDPGKAAGHPRNAGVIQCDTQNGYGADAVYVGAVRPIPHGGSGAAQWYLSKAGRELKGLFVENVLEYLRESSLNLWIIHFEEPSGLTLRDS